MKKLFILLAFFAASCEKETQTTSESGQHQTQVNEKAGVWAGFDAANAGTHYVTATILDSAGSTKFFAHGNDLYPDTYQFNIYPNDLCSIPNYFHVLPTGGKFVRGFGHFEGDTLLMYWQVEYYNSQNDHINFGNMTLIKQ